jgi:hypothetical protein
LRKQFYVETYTKKPVPVIIRLLKNQGELQRESTEEFKDGQRFRAGCEDSISVLKRVFNPDFSKPQRVQRTQRVKYLLLKEL